MKEVYSSELHEQRLLSEAETEAIVTQATEQLSKVIQMNEVAYSEEIASMSKKIDAQKKRFEEARESAMQNGGTNIGPGVESQSVKSAVARAREDAFELARDEINTAEDNWKAEHDEKLDALQKQLQAKYEAEIQNLRQGSPHQTLEAQNSPAAENYNYLEKNKSLQDELTRARADANSLRTQLETFKMGGITNLVPVSSAEVVSLSSTAEIKDSASVEETYDHEDNRRNTNLEKHNVDKTQITLLNEEKNDLLTEVEAHALKLKNVDTLLKTRERHYESSFAAATIQRMYRKSKMIQETRCFGREITKVMTAGKLRAAAAGESHALEIGKLKKHLKAAKITLQEEAQTKIHELRKTHEEELNRLHDYGIEREKIARETAQKSQAEAIASALQSALAEARVSHQASMEEALSVAHAEKESEIRKIRESDEKKLKSELARMKVEHEEILDNTKKEILDIKNAHQKVLKRTETDAQTFKMEMISSAAQSREAYSKTEASWKRSEAELYAKSQTAKLALLTSKREAMEEAEKLKSIGRSEMSDLRALSWANEQNLKKQIKESKERLMKLLNEKDETHRQALQEIKQKHQDYIDSLMIEQRTALRNERRRVEATAENAKKQGVFALQAEVDKLSRLLSATKLNSQKDAERARLEIANLTEQAKESALMSSQRLRNSMELSTKREEEHAEVLRRTAREKHESTLQEALSAANIVKVEALEESSVAAQRKITQLKLEMDDIKNESLKQAAEHEEALEAVETIHAADLLKKDKAHAKIVKIKVEKALKEAEEEAIRSNDKVSTKIKLLEDELEGMHAMHREDLRKERQKMQSIKERVNKRAEKAVEDKLREIETARKEIDKQSASARESAAAAKEAQKALDEELKKQQQISRTLTTVALRKRLRNLSQEHVKAQVLIKRHEADKAQAVADAIQMGESARSETMEKRFTRKLDGAIAEERQRLTKTHAMDIEELRAAHNKALAAKMRTIDAMELRLQKKNDALDKMRIEYRKKEHESSKQVHAELEEALSQTKRKMQDEATKHISEEAQAFQNKILAMEEAAAETKESHDMEMLTIREKYKANHVAVVDRLHRMETEHREVLSNLREEWEKEKSVEKVVYETDSRKLHSLEHNLQMSQHEAAALREQVKALQRSLEEEKSARRNLNLEKQNTRFEGYETEQKLNQLVRESKSSAVRSSYNANALARYLSVL
eukprot:g4628.t1